VSVYLGLYFGEEQNVFYNHKQLIRLIQQTDWRSALLMEETCAHWPDARQ